MGTSCQGRVALVTGASRGIGKAIATRLGAEGAAVALIARTQEPDAESLGSLNQTVEVINRAGGRSMTIVHDLGDPSVDRATLVDEVEAELGPVDILVNNAARNGYQLVSEWTDEAIKSAFELNFWSPWQLVRRVLPAMKERRSGWIVNVSSAAAEIPSGPPFSAQIVSTRGTIYGGTKAMLNRWTVSLAAEVYDDRIAVNTLSPQGAALTESLLVRRPDIPRDTIEPMETMAEAALALCTADPATLTGQVTYSLSLLLELNRPVFDLLGEKLAPEWDQSRLQAIIEAQAAQRARPPNGVVRSDVLDTRRGSRSG